MKPLSLSKTSYKPKNYNIKINSTGGKIRTHDLWFWRPLLYQLSYTRKYTNQ